MHTSPHSHQQPVHVHLRFRIRSLPIAITEVRPHAYTRAISLRCVIAALSVHATARGERVRLRAQGRSAHSQQLIRVCACIRCLRRLFVNRVKLAANCTNKVSVYTELTALLVYSFFFSTRRCKARARAHSSRSCSNVQRTSAARQIKWHIRDHICSLAVRRDGARINKRGASSVALAFTADCRCALRARDGKRAHVALPRPAVATCCARAVSRWCVVRSRRVVASRRAAKRRTRP